MMNTSLHNPSVKDKPSVDQFISMVRGIDDGGERRRDTTSGTATYRAVLGAQRGGAHVMATARGIAGVEMSNEMVLEQNWYKLPAGYIDEVAGLADLLL